MESNQFIDQFPKPILHGVKDGANVLITNIQYAKARRLQDGQYDTDKLYVVYRDMDTQKKKLQIIENPQCDIYTTKPEYMNDFKTPRDAMLFSKLDKHTVLYRDKENFLLKMLNKNLLSIEDKTIKSVIDRAIELGKYNGKKEIHKWRHAYYSDYEIQEYAHTTAFLHYNPKSFKLAKSFLDIEVDVYGRSKAEVEAGACPINAVTMIYDYDYNNVLNTDYRPKVFTYLLRNYKRYPQQKEFEDNIADFKALLNDEFSPQIGQADYYIKFYDDETLMLYDIFQTQHMLKPDFTEIWNMIFDIIYIMKRAKYLDMPPEVLFCHPDFKNVAAFFKVDERYKNDFKNCGHNFNCLSYTKYADQMLTYAAKRKGGTDYGSSGIDNIGKIEVGYRKRKFKSKATNVINAAIREYYNFVLYGIQDVVLQTAIERKVGDLDDVFMRAYETGCRFDKANRMTVSLRTLWDISHFEQGYVMCNNLNVDNISEYGQVEEVVDVDEDGENTNYEARLKGALVGNPTNLNNSGAEIFTGRKSNRLFIDNIDLDFASLYPNIKMVNNISRASQYGRLIIPNKVSVLEYGVTPELRGGEFLDDFTTHDWLKVGIKWFGLKTTLEYISEYSNYINSNTIKLRPIKEYRHAFHAVWAKNLAKLLDRLYPDYNSLGFAHKVFNRDARDVKCIMYNNYEDIEYTGTLLNIIDFIYEERPIITESGCFFKRPKDTSEISPGLITISNLGVKRAKIKKMELEYEENGDKENARQCNLGQNRVKRFANSEYGIGGAKSSYSYNYHVAQSVTSKGQTLISTAFTAFEDFMADTITFYDTDELIHYIMNIATEEATFDDNYYLDKNMTHAEVKTRLLKKCVNIMNFDDTIIDRLLSTCDQSALNRLYYKSNLLEFIENSSIKNLIRRFDTNAITFLDMNEMTKPAKKIMNEIINVVLEYCHYNYHWYGRVDRLIRLNRSSVITIDTDSNILTIHDPLVKFKKYMGNNANNNLIKLQSKVDIVVDHKHFKAVNTCASILTELIKRCLNKFKVATNVEEHILGKYEMKNEFYYAAMLVNSGKKRYLGDIRLREGHFLPKGKRDVKGFDFIKTTYATEDVNKYIQDTLFTHIVTSNINISAALNSFINLENMIRTSLQKGELTYLTPTKVSTIDSYKDPMKTGSFKATYIWNTLYPDKEIELPGIVYLIKLDINSPKDIAELAMDDREMFDKICALLKDKKGNHGDFTTGKKDTFAMNEITQIAIPIDTEEIPEWILKYADFDTMINKTMNLVIPVLEEIGVVPVFKRKNEKKLSNIIAIG